MAGAVADVERAVTSVALASVLVAAVCLLAAACGADVAPAGQPAGASTAAPAEKAPSTITRADKTYSLDDVVTAGWKKSKEFDASTLPHAISVTYGFFEQRDIEVWVFASHAEAREFGVAPAEEAVARKPGQTDYLIPRVNRYFAYAVAGNLVLLCERELADCEALIAKLP